MLNAIKKLIITIFGLLISIYIILTPIIRDYIWYHKPVWIQSQNQIDGTLLLSVIFLPMIFLGCIFYITES